MSWLALSASFIYLCYGSTAIIHFLFFLSAGIVFRRQNMASKVDPRIERVKYGKQTHVCVATEDR